MKMKESQYDKCIDSIRKYKRQSIGIMHSDSWINDPKHLVFVLSRYKFIAKLFSGFDNVLEIGCGDAFPSRIVAQEVKKLIVTDWDPIFIEAAKEKIISNFPFECYVHNILDSPYKPSHFDAVYALDVLEHISPKNEVDFIVNILDSMKATGVCVIGTPSSESQKYASEISKNGHVNCKSACELKAYLQKYFNNVFLFSMNDEVVHTGFSKMSHYLIALCCMPKKN